jgi:TetR/AcrR family acrAB operon transcriptional repressor
MPRRTKHEAEQTRKRILDTAERVFLKKGVSHTSLDDVAASAGVTRGAIYWHFKNKADLFDAMMQRVSLPMEEMAARVGADDLGDPLGAVRHCALSVLERLTSDPQCQRVFEICCHKVEYVDEMKQVRARHIQCRSECLAHIEQGLRNAVKKGALPRSVNPRLAAVGLHALVDGLIMNWVLDPKYFALAKGAERVINGYMEGLKAPPAKRARSTPRTRKTVLSPQ